MKFTIRNLIPAGIMMTAVLLQAPCQSIESELTVSPTLSIPLGPVVDGDLNLYTMGGGTAFEGDLYSSGLPFLFLRPSLDLDYMPLNNSNAGITMLSPAVSLGFRQELASRLILKAFGGGGLYYAVSDRGSVINPQIAAGAEADIRLTPSVSLGVGGRYRLMTTPTGPLYSGISVNLGVSMDLRAKKKTRGIQIFPALNPVFPLFFTYYNDNPAGQVSVKNSESLRYDNVEVSFHANQYMDGYKLSGKAESLKPGEEISLPVYALFNDSIFRVTEGTKVPGDFLVTWEVLGKSFSQSFPVTVEINNRNAMTWDDDRKAASFVTAKDPSVLGFSKNTVSLIRSDYAPPVSENFRTALALFQTMSVYGIGYAVDPATPFADYSADQQAVDFLQFPNQTLSYRAGDCDDISVLYAALLEAVGIPSAFITTPGHIFVAFDMGITPAQAGRFFDIERDLIVQGDRVWMPVEITLVKSGFLDAWRRGAQEWNEAANAGSQALYPVQEAWRTYEPVGFVEAGMIGQYPAGERVVQSYTDEIGALYDYINGPQIARIYEACREKGLSDVETSNRVAVYYAQMGMLDKAEGEFGKILRKERHVPSLVNLANIKYIREDWKGALALYEEASSLKPNNAKILYRTIDLLYNQSRYDEAQNYLARLQQEDQDMATAVMARYSGNSGTTRASDGSVIGLDDWEEEE